MSLGIRLNGYWHEWHVGEPVPRINSRVLQFQADGDELDLLIDAMSASRGNHPLIEWMKGEGFTVKPPAPPEPPKKKQYRIWYTPNWEDGCAEPQQIAASPTGIVHKLKSKALVWTAKNPANGGTWSIVEEEV